MVPTRTPGRYRSDEKPNEVFLRHFTRLPAAGRLLDLGCNLGREVEHASRHGWQADGCDVDPTVVAECNDRLRERCVPNAYVSCCSMQEYVASTEHVYHLVHCWHVLHYLTAREIPSIASGITRVLRPGGTLILRAFTEGERALCTHPERDWLLFPEGALLLHFPGLRVLEHFAGIINDPGSVNRPEPHQHAVELLVLQKPA